MYNIFPLHATDFYKTGHYAQYPPGTEYVYSNFTCRSDKFFKGLPDFDHKVVFFGLQAVCKWLLIEQWNKEFFNKPKNEVVARYKRRMDKALGPDLVEMKHVEELHDLGYLPIEIKALPEGARVNIRVPLYTIKNTHPNFGWVTNYLETQLSAETWKPITTATTAYEYRRLLDRYAELTGSSKDFVPWQGHDFSDRGMSGIYDGAVNGAAHLLSFTGTDTVQALDFLEDYYNASDTFIGGSVPATEHSVMCMGGKEDEVDTFRRLITKTYPKGIVSIVSDTWDFWKVITDYSQQLKYVILGRDGKVVFRPDCYSDDTQILTPEGWQFFKDIDENQLVAQVLEDGSYEFVKPLQYVEQHYEGDMCKFEDHFGKLDLLVTPNHRMIFNKESKLFVQKAKDVKAGYWGKNIVRSAKAPNKNRNLSHLDRLRIAFQADGSYVTGCHSSIRFSFSKKRKIDRLKFLAENAGISLKTYNLNDGKTEIHLAIPSAMFLKDFSWVQTSDLCSQWSEQFIEELSHWDSSIRNSGRFKFDTTTKRVMDVVELVAIAAGKGIYIAKTEDNRSDMFSDIYTAHILNNNMIGGQSIVKKVVQYSGNVYCVSVPSGMLLVKRNKGTAVCGNSGDPVDILCGTDSIMLTPEEMANRTPSEKGAVECLWEVFGGTITDKGYKLLDNHVGLIYGDSITLQRAQDILARLESKEFASGNVVFGIGSYTYNYVTRDTLGSAIKATWGVVNGEERNLFKDPVTDNGVKKSAKGLLMVTKEGNDYVLHDEQTKSMEAVGQLKTVLWNSQMMREQSLEEIRKELHGS